MLLYVCETCGVWSDMALVLAASKMLENLGRAMRGMPEVEETTIEPTCPAGHGAMRHVSNEDRLCLRPQSIEAVKVEAEHE